MAAITSAICANPDAHPDRDQRYLAAVIGGLFYCVLAGSAQAALANPTDREAAIVTLLIAASGTSIFDIGAPVWGLFIGGTLYLMSKRGRIS